MFSFRNKKSQSQIVEDKSLSENNQDHILKENLEKYNTDNNKI